MLRPSPGPLRNDTSRGLTFLAALVVLAGCGDQGPTGPDAPVVPPASHSLLSAADKDVLVGFTAAPGDAEAALVEAHGGRVTYRYKYIPALAATIPAAEQEALAAQAGVAWVQDDFTIFPLGGKQIVDYGVRLVEAPQAWALGYRGEGAKVGIFDSGIDVDHPDLTVHGGVDLVGDGRGLDDCNGHGTHVAGIVGANANGNHTVGVAPRARLYSMRLADCGWGGGTTSKMIQGLEWAIDNGMDVINMSFGVGIGLPTGGGVPLFTALDPAADAAVQAAYDAGIVLVAASGNSAGLPVKDNLPYVGWPASHPAVIAVGATDDQDALSDFSQYGTEQELTAPGVANLSSYLVGLGVDATLTVDTDGGLELEIIPMEFAGMTKKAGITSAAVYAGLGTAVEFETLDCAGNIAVVARGGTTFAEKAQAAMDAGCAAVIIHNNQPGNFNGTLGAPTTTDGRPWVPVASVTLDDGLYLRDRIASGPTVLTFVNAAGNLAVFGGTSMASPHVAGVAALVLGKSPGLTPDEVRTILRASSDDLGTPGWDPLFGYGRVNARRAVEETR